MVYRFVENQQKASVNFGGQFSGKVDKNTNKSETKVSLVMAKIRKNYECLFIQAFTVYLYKSTLKQKYK